MSLQESRAIRHMGRTSIGLFKEPVWAARAVRRILLAALLVGAGNLVVAADFKAGEHFAEVSPGIGQVATGVADGQTEVVELFWYGCPHCYSFEPILEGWAKEKPENIVITRVPAVFNKRWAFHAQVFYTAEVLGVLDQVHLPLFDAIHKGRRQMATEDEIAELLERVAGVDRATFDQAFNSFAVDAKLRRAAQITRDAKLTGVPALMIGGTARTTASQAGGYEQMLELAEALSTSR